MTYRGQIKQGQIFLDEPVLLPDGATVNVELAILSRTTSAQAPQTRIRKFEPIDMPGDSLADELTRDRR